MPVRPRSTALTARLLARRVTDDGKLIPAAAFLKAHKALPQVVFFPEESDFQYRSGTAPLQDDWGGAALGTPLGAHLLYGRDAFVFELMQFTPGGHPGPEPIFNNRSLMLEFAKIVQRGDVLRYQGWYNDSVNVFVKKVYEMAAAMPPLKSDDADVLAGDAGSAANSSVVFECRGKEGRDVHPNGYDDIRIPALLRLSNGDLLLFVEARIFSSDDNSPIDIAYKRSVDNGSSWSKLAVLHSETNATHNTTINNPNPVEDRRHPGTVHVVFSRAYRDMLVMSSTNYGRTFSAPIDISKDVLPVGTANWSKLVAGPAGAVQIEPSGRIAICARFSTIPRGAISTQGLVVYSDTGSSWHGIAQPTGWSECAFAQAPNSSVVAVLRQGLWRGFAWSEDNAKTFSDCGHTCSALPLVSSSNDCQAGLATLSDGAMVLTQPHGDPIDAKTPESVCGSMNGRPVVWPDGHTGKGGNGRCNVSLHVSRDSARTWVAERVIAPPPVESGYSSVAALSPTAVGVAFEASCSISFVVEAGLSNPLRLRGKSDDDELAWVEEPQGWHQVPLPVKPAAMSHSHLCCPEPRCEQTACLSQSFSPLLQGSATMQDGNSAGVESWTSQRQFPHPCPSGPCSQTNWPCASTSVAHQPAEQVAGSSQSSKVHSSYVTPLYVKGKTQGVPASTRPGFVDKSGSLYTPVVTQRLSALAHVLWPVQV